jgi:hypothetical protein
MKIEKLKQLLNDLPKEINGVPTDELELFVRNGETPNGEMAELVKIESSLNPLDDKAPYLILNVDYTNEKTSALNDANKDNSKVYNENLAIQNKVLSFLSARADDETVQRYLKKQVPGKLSEVDYYFIMRLLSELVGEPVSKAQFELCRDHYFEAIMAFDLEQVKKGK